MADERIGDFLERLASRSATPAGGAVAALGAAHAAALLAMVARYTSGPTHAAVATEVGEITRRADELRARAHRLAIEDETAFEQVAAAHALPGTNETERQSRRVAVERALVAASWPPAELAALTREVVSLAEQLEPIAHRSVRSDLGAACDAAAAAASTSRTNVEANVHGNPDGSARDRLLHCVAGVEETMVRAAAVTAAVRGELVP